MGHPIHQIFDEIHSERLRQEKLRAQGKFAWTCSSLGIPHAEKLAVLSEEFGEAAREVVEGIIAAGKGEPRENDELLYSELIQIAAVCVAWCEAMRKAKRVADLDAVEHNPAPVRSNPLEGEVSPPPPGCRR